MFENHTPLPCVPNSLAVFTLYSGCSVGTCTEQKEPVVECIEGAKTCIQNIPMYKHSCPYSCERKLPELTRKVCSNMLASHV